MARELDADYLVVGAGAMGMAFTDALVDHDPEARVAMVDRRDGVGGHWRRAYPFVRLHQASQLYGVASTVLGGQQVQRDGPEAGLHERADRATICRYYDDVLARLVGSGRVELLPRTDHVGGRRVESLETGEVLVVPDHCRVVDARYLSPDIPAEMPPRFVVDGAHVVPVSSLPDLEDPPSQYVVIGSGKTATDAIVWLRGEGVDPDEIRWVRPRDPWMLDRARIQPDPVVYLGMFADLMGRAATAPSLPDLFLGLEEDGTMLRIDRSVMPTMAKTPTLGRWELDLLREVEHVVRLGHVRAAREDRLELDDGTVRLPPGAVVVNCAADGLKNPPLVPIWSQDAITLQPIRAGFPCFAAALAGYVEATRDSDEAKNALCPPSSYANSLTQWAWMNIQGVRASASFGSQPDIKEWSDRVHLNPSRIPPERAGDPAVDEVLGRLRTAVPRGLANLETLVA